MIKVEIRDLHKSFGDHEVLRGIDCDVETGEVVCVIGPSGSGKSTFLRCINCLEQPTSGTIKVDGHIMDENAKNINIEDHINTTLYQEALAEATAEFGSEAPDFYAKQLTFFNENNL